MEDLRPDKDTHALWLVPPESLTLDSDEVHVWRSSLEMIPSHVKTLGKMLSADELSRADRFRFQKDRDHFIAARGFLRLILGRYLGIEPSDIRFCYGPYGKPMLDDESDGHTLRFNLSHSCGLSLYAVTRERKIGIDLECIRSALPVHDIADQFFSLREKSAFRAISEHNWREAFFTWWTRKEAFLKAQGKGLSGNLTDIEVFCAPGNPANAIEIYDPRQEETPWLLRDLHVERGFAAAVTVEGYGWQLECFQWDNAYHGIHC